MIVTTRPRTFFSYRAAGIESRFSQDSQVTTNPIASAAYLAEPQTDRKRGFFGAFPFRPAGSKPTKINSCGRPRQLGGGGQAHPRGFRPISCVGLRSGASRVQSRVIQTSVSRSIYDHSGFSRGSLWDCSGRGAAPESQRCDPPILRKLEIREKVPFAAAGVASRVELSVNQGRATEADLNVPGRRSLRSEELLAFVLRQRPPGLGFPDRDEDGGWPRFGSGDRGELTALLLMRVEQVLSASNQRACAL